MSVERCRRCGAPVSQSVEGLCSGCLLRWGLLEAESSDAAARPRVLTVLGESAWATCYLAEDADEPGMLFVLKLITRAAAADTLVAEVERLRGLARRLRHPHVARVRDVGIDGRHPYVLTEYWPGLPVTAYAARHALDEAARLAFLDQIVSALEAAHSMGLVHGSLTPSNLLVAGSAAGPALKVLDFGHARLSGRRHAAGTPAGDLHALELLRHEILARSPS